MKKFILCAFMIIFAYLLSADNLTVEASVNRNTIGINDMLYYTIEISGSDANRIGTPNLPKINGFVNQGSSQSSSTSISIVNGRTEQVVTKNYKYSLKPTKQGKIKIPSITLKYKKKSYKTDPFIINVVPGSNEPAPNTGRRSRNTSDQTSGKLSDNLFIEAEISDEKPYLNEPVEITYYIYSNYDVSGLSFNEVPSFAGFWKEESFSAKNLNFYRKSYNGKNYNAMKLKTYVLFPSQTGKLIIDPFSMNVDIRTRSNSFFSFGSSKSYKISSDNIKINVQELPSNPPKNFSGAVGNFHLNSSISDDNLKVGDSFTYTLEITGNGNFNNLQLVELPPINHLRFLDPEITTPINTNKKSGKKILRYLVIAQEPGQFTIPSLSFSYFDPTHKKYRTLRSDQYEISVAEGDNLFIPGSASQSAVKIEGSDIGFIIEDNELENFQPWFESIIYWLIIFLIFISLPVTSMLLKRKSDLASNIDYQRQKRAQRILKKYLKLATEHHKNANPAFYSAATSGLENYLTDKLKIPRGSRQDDIIIRAHELKIDDSLISRLSALFKKCNEARFMPGGFSPENINNDFDTLQNIIAELTKIKI